MVITEFSIDDTVGMPRFFQKTFLVANTKFKEILEMSFMNLRNADILFN